MKQISKELSRWYQQLQRNTIYEDTMYDKIYQFFVQYGSLIFNLIQDQFNQLDEQYKFIYDLESPIINPEYMEVSSNIKREYIDFINQKIS